jgi:hypothetical protein
MIQVSSMDDVLSRLIVFMENCVAVSPKHQLEVLDCGDDFR